MASYTNILNHVFSWEGGLVYHANEGQYTNMGIQYSTYVALCKKLLGINPNFEHFKKLTQAEVGKFIQYYWNQATYGNRITNQDAANLMFQAYWGSGNAGIEDMQEALNKSTGSQLVIDGNVGPSTVAVINKTKKAPQILYAALDARYRRLAQSNTYSKYLNGWLNRLAELTPAQQAAGGIGTLAFLGIAYYLFQTR